MKPAITYKEISSNIMLDNSLFFEIVQILLDVSDSKRWLQSIVNLLNQFFNSDNVILKTYIDNLVVLSSPGLINSKHTFTNITDKEPYWHEDRYIVPLSVEGVLEILWTKKPDEQELANFQRFFLLIEKSLNLRADLICHKHYLEKAESLSIIESILNNDSNLKSKLFSCAKEIASWLNVSRCQIKMILDDSVNIYDINLSSEYVNNSYVEAISVIPSFEHLWLKQIVSGTHEILNILPASGDTKSMGVENLLSVKSALGVPIIYRGKPVGVVLVHQCDYERSWSKYEILYLEHLAIMLSTSVCKECFTQDRDNHALLDSGTKLLNADEFLRELSHIQIQTQTSNSRFSLILIDIEKLNDINSKWGFVAGNLVISQTARHLSRYYDQSAQIARYNSDEFILILPGIDEKRVKEEASRLKERLKHLCILGVGPVDYNFSTVTYPVHCNSVPDMLTLLEQTMIIAKSRGKGGMCTADEIQGSTEKWQKLISRALPEIILKRSSLKTGPELIDQIHKQVSEQNEKNILNPDLLDSVQSLAIALDAKDSYTEGHSKRVSEYAYLLAKHIGLDLQEREWVRLAAALHDIGKIGIPESILCKPGKLTKEEFEVMKQHPVIGARILKPIKQLEVVAHYVLYHHENWNGCGYPHGLSGEKIPIGSRIVSIVDAYQAMTSDRPYRARLPFDEAIKRLKDGKGTQWDPDLIDTFIKLVV